MRIKNITIQNFKGFELKEFHFNPSFNVAIGNNAMGKSTLLHAIQVSLGAYLQCLPIPVSKNYRRPFRKGETFVKWNADERSYEKDIKPTLIKTVAEFSQSKAVIEWTRVYQKNNNTSHNRNDTGELMDQISRLMDKEVPIKIGIPIVASFGTERTVAQLRKGKKAQSRRVNIEKGFLACLSEKVDFDGVIEWIHDYDEKLKYNQEFEGTKEAFYEALHKAIPYLKNIEYNHRDQEFRAEVTIDNNTIGKTTHNNMSDGFKAMLNLVAEIAFRCVILNGFKGIYSVVETEGVVLIDELDMHLHPSWQRHVVNDLKSAFPKLQFIVTTHSPFIIQSLKKEELINLDFMNSDIQPSEQTIDKIVTDVMGVKNINGDDFEKRHNTALATLEELGKQPSELDQNDFVKLKQIVDGILITDTTDPIYKAYLKVKNNGN